MLERKVKALVGQGFGLNCDNETGYALEQAGAEVDLVHFNELFWGERSIHDYQIMLWIGGFSFGDEFGAGQVLANKVKDNLMDDLLKFIDDGKLVLGICNGYQALTNLGLLPGYSLNGEKRLMGVMYNDAGNFIDIWTRLEVNKDSPCVYTKGMDYLEFPVRHGEGKVVAHKKHADTIWQKLRENNQVTVRYCLRRQDEPADGKFPDNPNGSKYDTAGICDRTGRVFGLMPHPEAYNHCTNHYLYSREKERRRIEGLPPVSEEGAGIQIFRNAVRYAEENLL